jgi:catechol 1,2-dioxygenase
MIIRTESDVTAAVCAQTQRASDPRLREIITALVTHLHAFVRDVRLTEDEFRAACAIVAELGQRTTPSHNEVVLMAGSLGISTLVCLLNNGDGGATETTANLLGPFWRAGSPRMPDGASIVRSPTPGAPLFVTARVVDRDGTPVAGADVDVWHSAADGFYENQDPGQADMNLRGTFTTGADGCIRLRTIKPAGYPIPVDGPVGDLLRALGRHNMRPAHVHFLVAKPGYKTHIAQVYASDDPYLDSDVQFGVTRALIGTMVRHASEPAPDAEVTGDWYSLTHTLIIDAGEMRLPRAPITGKSQGERPELTILQARAAPS